MKANKIWSIMVMLVLVLGTTIPFSSCSKDDDNGNEVIDDVILGTWQVTDFKTTQSESYRAWEYQTTIASFKSDGTYYGSGFFGNGSGTWSKKGNIVITYVSGKQYATYEVISVTSTTAELKMSVNNASIWMKCKKQ